MVTFGSEPAVPDPSWDQGLYRAVPTGYDDHQTCTEESDITASYKDGILEIRIPAPAPEPATKIAISKS